MFINNKIWMKPLHCESTSLFPCRGNSNSWEDSDYRIRWEGFVFVNGIPSEGESLKVFIKEVQSVGIVTACRLLKGTFFMLVENKVSQDMYAFVDNSGLYQAYYTDKIISTSFLELIKCEGNTYKDLDLEAVVEFIHLGYIYASRTFFRTIKKISRGEMLHVLPQDCKVQILQKYILNIDSDAEKGSKSFRETFEGLAVSLSNRKVSIDLTGGFDSRVIAVMLDYFGVDFETAISGRSDHEDVIISKEVAEVLGHTHYCTPHSITTLEDDINELFYVNDGLSNILGYHRLLQHQKERRLRGIDTMITGEYGGFFNDLMWLQDFPFYSKRVTNFKRYVNLRIMPIEPDHMMLNDTLIEISTALRKKIAQYLSKYALSTNTRTYDNIDFNLKMRSIAGRSQTTNSCFLKSYSPYTDLDMVKIGFNLSRTMRFYDRYRRQILTKINPLVAKICTTQGGVSASSETMILARDLFKYVVDKLKRSVIKLEQRALNKEIANIVVSNNLHLYPYARKMVIMKDHIETLKCIGIINQDIELAQIKDVYLGRLMTLAMLVKFMKDKCY